MICVARLVQDFTHFMGHMISAWFKSAQHRNLTAGIEISARTSRPHFQHLAGVCGARSLQHGREGERTRFKPWCRRRSVITSAGEQWHPCGQFPTLAGLPLSLAPYCNRFSLSSMASPSEQNLHRRLCLSLSCYAGNGLHGSHGCARPPLRRGQAGVCGVTEAEWKHC